MNTAPSGVYLSKRWQFAEMCSLAFFSKTDFQKNLSMYPVHEEMFLFLKTYVVVDDPLCANYYDPPTFAEETQAHHAMARMLSIAKVYRSGVCPDVNIDIMKLI